jgi:hypothetical protein
MLVVTRRPGESIVIELPTGELIEVTVVRVKGKQVRLATDTCRWCGGRCCSGWKPELRSIGDSLTAFPPSFCATLYL